MPCRTFPKPPPSPSPPLPDGARTITTAEPRIEELPILDLRIEDVPDFDALEERLLREHGVSFIPDFHGLVSLTGTFTLHTSSRATDEGIELRRQLTEALGRHIDVLVRVDMLYPIDWRPDDMARCSDALMQMSSYVQGTCLYYASEPSRLHLENSFEPNGLHVFGIVRRAMWDEWSTEFERRTAGMFHYRY